MTFKLCFVSLDGINSKYKKFAEAGKDDLLLLDNVYNGHYMSLGQLGEAGKYSNFADFYLDYLKSYGTSSVAGDYAAKLLWPTSAEFQQMSPE